MTISGYQLALILAAMAASIICGPWLLYFQLRRIEKRLYSTQLLLAEAIGKGDDGDGPDGGLPVNVVELPKKGRAA